MSDADFRMIRPIAITAAKLTSSTVLEATVAEYASGATYAQGDLRGVTTGTAQAVYESLKAGNVDHTPATSPTWWKPRGTVYAAYSSGTAYALNDIVTDPATHQLYQSLIAGNSGNSLADATKWYPLGSTNRHKMFDKVVNSQSVAPESISFTVTLGQIANALTLLNLAGSTVSVTQADSGYSASKSLVRHEVLNWYDFWYEEPIRQGDALFDDIPPYPSSPITVTVINPGDYAAIGGAFFGKARTIGKTRWDLTAGVLSYSTSDADKDGNVTMNKRANARRMNLEVYITPGFESEAYRLLTEYTDVEMVFIGAKNYEMTYAYGFLGQWDVPITNSGKTAPIEIRGLI